MNLSKRILFTLGIAALAAVPALAVTPPKASAPIVTDGVKRGVDAWEAGDYAKAVAEWRPLADKGDPDAQFNLAQAYRLGRGVPSDPALARSFYQKAAMQDHVQAQANYGLLLFEKGDRQAAMPWIEKAANKGDPRAQYILGTAMFNGDPVPRDWVKGYAFMTRAAAAGLPPAITSLGEMDRYIPLDQRQRGTALAADLARSATITAPPPVVAARPSPPAPIRPVAIPASMPAPKPAPAPPVKFVAVKPVPAKPEPKAESAKPAPFRAAPAAVEAKTGDWRIQIGAYADGAKARGLWSSLSKKVPGLGAIQPYFVKAGAVTRLQGGPLPDRAAASKLCAAVKAAGQDCFPARS